MRNESPFLCKAITPTIIPFKPFPVKFPETSLSPLSLSCNSTVKKTLVSSYLFSALAYFYFFPVFTLRVLSPFLHVLSSLGFIGSSWLSWIFSASVSTFWKFTALYGYSQRFCPYLCFSFTPLLFCLNATHSSMSKTDMTLHNANKDHLSQWYSSTSHLFSSPSIDFAETSVLINVSYMGKHWESPSGWLKLFSTEVRFWKRRREIFCLPKGIFFAHYLRL